MSYETEIQGILYTTLIGDAALQTALGGATADKRVYLEWNQSNESTITTAKPGWIVIETLTESAPMGEDKEVQLRAVLWLYTAMSNIALRGTIRARLEALFDCGHGSAGIWKRLTTTSYLVDTKSGGLGAPGDDRGLMQLPYYIDIKYRPK